VLEHMVLKHTKDYTERKLLEEITSLGGSYNAVTDRDVTFYYIMTHINNYRKCMDIIKSVLTVPVFQKAELDIERKVVLEEVNRRRDADADLLNLSYLTVLSPSNKYAQPIEGYEKTLQAITVNDLTQYFKEKYKDTMIVINCDAKSKDEVQRYALRTFGANKNVDFNRISDMYGNMDFSRSVIIAQRGYKQYTTHITFPSFPRNMTKQNVVLGFIKYCLVSSGLYSILTFQLRSKRGLIYSVSAMNEIYRYLGVFRIVISTSDKHTDLIVSIVFDILNKMKTKGINSKVLKYFKHGYLNEQKYALTNDEFKTIWHGESMFYDCDISDTEYIDLVKSISNEDVKEIASTVFDFYKVGIMSYGRYKSLNVAKQLLEDLIDTYAVI
jgi:predicted Zn-dependent peptidase